MSDHDPSGDAPDLQELLDRADDVFKEMKLLLAMPSPDFVKLRRLDEEERLLAQQMASTVCNKSAQMYKNEEGSHSLTPQG